MAQKPVCIRRTGTVAEADIIVAWLAEQGIEATVLDHENPGMMAFGVTDFEGAAVCVADAETAERAEALLDEHDKTEQAEAPPTSTTDHVDVTCAECGQVNSFPPHLSGTVQECSDCGSYLDVPANGEPPG